MSNILESRGLDWRSDSGTVTIESVGFGDVGDLGDSMPSIVRSRIGTGRIRDVKQASLGDADRGDEQRGWDEEGEV